MTNYKDHIVANPDKYDVTNNPDGTMTIRPTYLSRPSEIIQQGTPIDANMMNGITSQLAEKAPQTALDSTNTDIDRLSKQLVPKRYVFGGQLEKLKYALSNPLEQYMSIVFVGDSITWGMTLPENPANYNTGRDGTLSDIRDVYASSSYVNLIKKYIGSRYFFNASAVLSNWSASPGGQSIVEFSRAHTLFPFQGDFINDYVEPINNPPIVSVNTFSTSGAQLSLNVGSAQSGHHRLAFTFTGKEFTLFYASIPNSMKYELFVDGVSQGVFDTAPGVDGNVDGYNNQRNHSFDYVKNKLIEIKTVRGTASGIQTLKIDGIQFNKKVRISNQGIIGTNSLVYKTRNLEGNTSGDGNAIGADDRYIFVQLGTNDRIITSGQPKGAHEFKKNLTALIDSISSGRDLILMAANPAANESPASFSFNMQDVRNTVYQVAKSKNIDFIDNYSIYGDVSTTVYTADGLHPNADGHLVMARNIINALEFN